MKRTGVLTAAIGVAAMAAMYDRVIRPAFNTYGATTEELLQTLPLDDRVTDPTFVQQLGITIEATPVEIWPWIVQMGEPPRAGYYSYTFIEKLVGLDVVNRDQILPEYQALQVGDAIDKKGTMTVLDIDPGRHLVLGPPPSVTEVQATWGFFLQPIDAGSTRLVTRCRAVWDMRGMLKATDPMSWGLYLLIEPGAFIMSFKMLREIKRLAETNASTASRESPIDATADAPMAA